MARRKRRTDGEAVASAEVLADVVAETMDEEDIRRYARMGVHREYEDTLRWQARMKRMFPGVDKEAWLTLRQEQAARARAAKQTRQQARG